MSKPLDLTYTSIFESVRTMGTVLAPSDLVWQTEVSPNFPKSEYLIHLSCLAHFTPHIAYLAQKILLRLGIDAPILGGPEACCGTIALHMGHEDIATQGARMGVGMFRRAKASKILSVCPDCDESFNKFTTSEGSIEVKNVAELLLDFKDRLKAECRPVADRAAFHSHRSNAMRSRDMDIIANVLAAIPGFSMTEIATGAIVDKPHCSIMFAMKADQQELMLRDAIEQNFDILVVPYHSCYRQHCGLEYKSSLAVKHYLEIIADSLGIAYEEPYKALRLVDTYQHIIKFCKDRLDRVDWPIAELDSTIELSLFPYATDKARLAELKQSDVN